MVPHNSERKTLVVPDVIVGHALLLHVKSLMTRLVEMRFSYTLMYFWHDALIGNARASPACEVSQCSLVGMVYIVFVSFGKRAIVILVRRVVHCRMRNVSSRMQNVDCYQ